MKREITKTEETGNKPEIFVLRPYNHKQLADFYGVCWLTFQRWVKKTRRRNRKEDWTLLQY
jgi:hypothetical protein